MSAVNLNPVIHDVVKKRTFSNTDFDDSISDTVDSNEIFDLIRHINDPEHPVIYLLLL